MNTKTELQPESIAKHLQALLQIGVTIKQGTQRDLKGPLVRAEISDGDGTLVCVLLADTAAAGSTGAALSKIPAGAVQDIVRRAQLLDDDLLANFYEVANVLTVLTTQTLSRRTILRALTQGSQISLAEDFVARAPHKVFFQVAVQAYPVGGLAFFHL